MDKAAGSPKHSASPIFADELRCADLWKPDKLALGYASVVESLELSPEDPGLQGLLKGRPLLQFLQQLSALLVAGEYQVANIGEALHKDASQTNNPAWISDLIVLSSLNRTLERLVIANAPGRLAPTEAVERLAGLIERGMTRVFAVCVDEPLGHGGFSKRLHRLELVFTDPSTFNLLQSFLAIAKQEDSLRTRLSTSILGHVITLELDQILKEAQTLGREGAVMHLTGACFGSDAIILTDQDARFEWLLPALQLRIREVLTDYGFSQDHAKTQNANLLKGDRLRVLGHELRLVRAKKGVSRVDVRKILPKRSPIKHERASWKVPGRGLTKYLGNAFRNVFTAHWRILLGLATAAILFAAVGIYFATRPKPIQEHGFVRKTFFSNALQIEQDYVLFIPAEYESEGTRAFPALICLHEAWETYKTPIGTVQDSMGPAITARKKDFPFFALFPKSNDGRWRANSPDIQSVLELLTLTERTYRINPRKVYLMGRGSGAAGILHLAAAFPRRWAAIVPLSPTSFEDPVEKLSGVPCWCFLAFNRSPKLADETRHWIEGLRASGGKPRFTELEGMGTGNMTISDRAFANPELYKWMLQQSSPLTNTTP